MSDTIVADLIPEVSDSFPDVEYLMRGEKVKGKDAEGDGASNKQATALARRTAYLKALVESMVVSGIVIKGRLNDVDDLDDIPVGNRKVSDGYFVGDCIYVWNGTAWIGSESLLGPRGIALMGPWPAEQPLPDYTLHEVGTAYVWRNDLWVLGPQPHGWLSLNVKGPAGDDAFDIAVADGFEGNRSQWLASLIGESAYQTWLRKEGNAGKTEEQFIADLKSTVPGPRGEAAVPFVVKGVRGSEEDLPLPGDPAESYMVGQNMWVFNATTNSYFNAGAVRGHSNYQVWLASGNTGTEQDFLDTLKSTVPGPASTVPGPKGDPASPFRLVGILPDASQLPVPGDAAKAYYIDDSIHVWSELLEDYLVIEGVRALSNYEYAKLNGYVGSLEDWQEEVLRSQIKGDQGDGYRLKGRVARYEDLPTLSPLDGYPEKGDGYVTNHNGVLYVVNPQRTNWINMGVFASISAYQSWLNAGNSGSEQDFVADLRGADGNHGENVKIDGTVPTFEDLPTSGYESGTVLSVTSQSELFLLLPTGEWTTLGKFRGAAGADGRDGVDGRSFNVVKVFTEEDSTFPPAAENVGNAIVALDGHYHFAINGNWVRSNSVSVKGDKGDKGDKGETGPAFVIRSEINTVAELPNASTLPDGASYRVRADGLVYTVVEGAWNDGVDLNGPASTVPGPKGADGVDGTSIVILGSYQSEAHLYTDRPTGSLGDGYLIGVNLWIWTTDAGGKWINVGPVRGPAGPAGPVGPASMIPGSRGKRGASWLPLPEGVDAPDSSFFGERGDWCISTTMKVYYRDVTDNWMYWGTLTPQDTRAVVIDKDDAVETKLYVRIGVAGGSTVWTELDLSEFVTSSDLDTVTQYIESLESAIADKANNADLLSLSEEINGKVNKPIISSPAGNYLFNAVGDTKRLDEYDLKRATLSATATIDINTTQTYEITNTAATAKVFTLTDGPKDTLLRTKTMVITITGKAGTVTFNPTGSTELIWDDGAPTLARDNTMIVLYWTGSKWLGSVKPYGTV